jgi:hypothetical protein
MLKKLASILGLILVATQVHARGIDLRLADETAEIIYLTESSTFGYGGADMGFGLLFNEGDDFMLSAAAMVSGHGAGNNRPVQMGVGVKLIYASLDAIDEDVAALALGLQVRYIIPSSTPVAFLLEGHVAPAVTSFSDAEQYREIRFAIELEVTPSARAYLGYRNIEVDLDPGPDDIELDDEIHIGIKIDF